jgi:hypothetical protein
LKKPLTTAHVVVANYREPGPRDAEGTLNQLIQIIDNQELYDAMGELLKAEGRAPKLVPY